MTTSCCAAVVLSVARTTRWKWCESPSLTDCVCVFIKLHITAQFGHVILVIIYMPLALILPSKGGSMILCVSVCVCVCVCVCCPPIFSGRQASGRTSRGHTGGRSHRISHPPSFCGACLDFSREKDSAVLFPRRPWSRILCTTNESIVLHLLGVFYFLFFIFWWGKIPVRVTAPGFELTSQRQKVSKLPTEPPGLLEMIIANCKYIRTVVYIFWNFEILKFWIIISTSIHNSLILVDLIHRHPSYLS